MKRWIGLALAATILVAGCAGGKQLLAQEETPQDIDWRRVATPQDRTRLRQWRQAWVEALAMARVGGAAKLMLRDAMLFDPDRSLPGARLAAGQYRCRVIKVGGRDAASPTIMTRDWTQCVVATAAGRTTFSLDGAQRLHGYLFADTDTRAVFLGTLALGDETRPMRYGRDAKRDAAGFVERIGAARWRLILPYPGFESTLDLVEIVPVV
ncbi:MAG: DUF4893 domain-containing protein [Pseudomonadota bacterium]|nr:DUF4893 domain-containing protein [Pseudomonadota bacterium]